MATSVITDSTVSPSLLAAMNPKAATDAPGASADLQNRFMTLLVAQMKNQDPLNPLDNAQVTSQLAQLQTVTGIDKLNTTLQAMQTDYQSSQSLQAASMIGHGVLVPGSNVALGDGKSVFGLQLDVPAQDVQITIRDSAGKAIHTIDLGPQDAGTLPLTWDGSTDSGTTAADGNYKIEVSATNAGKKITGVSTLSFGQVASVSTGAQGLKLNLTGGSGQVNFSDVKQIL